MQLTKKGVNMTPLSFKGYGVRGNPVTVIAERITHWIKVESNGNYGTEIHLDTGESVLVGDWYVDVEKAFKAAAGSK